MITYTKLKNGDWGIRGEGLVAGQVVTVTKKSGETKTEKVTKVLFEGIEGNCIASVEATTGQNTRRSRNWRPCGYPGCNPSYCDECDGEGFT